jgi:hypothetical protein
LLPPLFEGEEDPLRGEEAYSRLFFVEKEILLFLTSTSMEKRPIPASF